MTRRHPDVAGCLSCPPRTRTPKPPRVSERHVQRHIIQALRTVGAAVYVLGTTRPKGDRPGTCQTPGIPDLYVLLPDSPEMQAVGQGRCAHGLWIEVKAAGGRLRPQQAEFASLCGGAGIPHLVGGLDVVLTYLQQHGYIKEAAHYRRTA